MFPTLAGTPISVLPAVPGKTRIGWIGTGVMVFNRTASKADELVARGAARVHSAREVAERSDVVFSIVGFPQDVRETVLGPQGALAGLAPGGVLVDMTTSDPALAREIAATAAAAGVAAVDAPVSGGDAGARNATLAIMCGGDPAVVAGLRPLLDRLGTAHVLGGPGAGQSCKMANQVTIASTMVGLVEGMLYAHKAGLDVDAYLAAVRGGAAGSRSMELYSPRLRARDFAPGFYVKHFVKDLGIALEECRRMGLALPGLALAQQLYVAVLAQGGGEHGTQALLLALERMNATQLLPPAPAADAPAR